MPTVYVFAGQKGGAGKSTMAIAVAAELMARGRKVLLVDADPQGTSTTWADVAAEAGHATPTVVSMGANMHRPGQLDTVAKPFDVVVVDCPPRHGEIMRAALMIADVAILPCGPSAVDAWALGESLDVLAQARTLKPEIKACVVITRKVARTALGKNAREVVAASGLPVLSAELHYRVAYQEAPAAGLGVVQYAAGTPAATEVQALVTELETFNTTGAVSHEQQASGDASQAVA